MELSDLMIKKLRSEKGMEEVMPLGINPSPFLLKDVLTTGLPNLDRILSASEDGRWGLPVGRIVSIKSKPGVGKTTFLLEIAKQAFKRGGAVALIESERALDLKYAKKICPTEKILISQPDTLEQAFESLEGLINLCLKVRQQGDNVSPFVILMDSFSGFTTEAEKKGGGGGLGEHARIASMACRKLTGPISKAKALFILSHQTKSKIGVFWGSTETNIGGDAFNFHDSISLNLYRTVAIKDSKKKIIGHYGMIKTTKNKLFPPHREAKFKIINGKGFNKFFSVLDFLLESGSVIRKSGGVFYFKEDKNLSWRGLDNFEEAFAKDAKMRKMIKSLLLQR